MALGRDYKGAEINVQDQRKFVQANVAQADTRVQQPLEIGDSSWRDKLLLQFGTQAVGTLNKMADLERTNQYLEGQAQAGIIESEDELEGNPLTRDWKVAGYRDTMGKLALADNEAQFAVDIASLREQGPEKFSEYLSKRRVNLQATLGSMSREARASSAGQMLLQDRAATKKWTTEHGKFIVEQKIQALDTSMAVSLGDLKAAQTGVLTGQVTREQYDEGLRNTFGLLVGGTWMDNGLTTDVKQANTLNSLMRSLSDDQPDLYAYANSNPVPDGRGGSSTLVSRLSSEDQTKLGAAYRESMQRTSDIRNLARHEQLAAINSQIDSGTYTGTYNELTATLGDMVVNKYLDAQAKSETASLSATALRNGDVQALNAMGKTEEQAVNDMQTSMVKQGLPPNAQLQQWLRTGQNGSKGAYKKAGELVGFAVRQMATAKDGEVLKQHLEIFKQADASLTSLEGAARTVAKVDMLSGMPEADRMFAEQIFGLVQGGNSYDGAIAQARKDYELNSKLSEGARAAMSATKAKDINTAVAKFEPTSVLENIWLGAKSMFGSTDAKSLSVIQPESYINFKDGIFGDSPTIEKYVTFAKEAVTLEAYSVMQTQPSASPDQVMSVAMANVASRTISTDFGPLIAPKGTDLGGIFGVGASNVAAIGPAINKVLKQTKNDTSFTLQFSEGRIWTQEYSRNGELVGDGKYLDTAQVKAQIAATDAEKTKRNNGIFGTGTKVTGSQYAEGKITKATPTGVKQASGIEITYNGLGTSGAPASWVYDFRTNLVNHEGVRDVAYRDLSGNKDKNGNPIMTNGVGVSSHNQYYPTPDKDGRITSAQASSSFDLASNAAATAGARVAKDTGFYSASGFQLFSELAYQSGTAFNTQDNKTGGAYRQFMAAMKMGDPTIAKEAFKRTAAWYYSADKKAKQETPRQQSYLNLIDKAMKGQ